MNLNKQEIEELNVLLANPKIDLPTFRRGITPTGGNYEWLQKHVTIRNKNLNKRILTLLNVPTT